MHELITLAHGAGGRASARLLDELILRHFPRQRSAGLKDAATISLADFAACADCLAMTTDSFVVTPQIFPGGDIGMLAINGTLNDLAMVGAVPQVLSLGLILEEGLPLATLDRLLASAAKAAAAAQVEVVTGDTKVVERGAADQLYINTTGVGAVPAGRQLLPARVREGDAVIVSGDIGRHGATIMASRADLQLTSSISSDCAALHPLVEAIFAAVDDPGDIRCLRDATRGGLATVLNEVAADAVDGAGCEIEVEESCIPVQPAVQGLCELLGLDPLYLACEGRMIALVDGQASDAVVAALRQTQGGADARCIGRVAQTGQGRVVLRTTLGSRRQLDVLVDAQQPRIC